VEQREDVKVVTCKHDLSPLHLVFMELWSDME